MVMEGGDDGGSWGGDELGSLHESCELDDDGEAVARTSDGELSFWAWWRSRCVWALLAVMDTSQGEQMGHV